MEPGNDIWKDVVEGQVPPVLLVIIANDAIETKENSEGGEEEMGRVSSPILRVVVSSCCAPQVASLVAAVELLFGVHGPMTGSEIETSVSKLPFPYLL